MLIPVLRAVLWGVVWNRVVVPYMGPLPDPLMYQPSSAFCFVNISSFNYFNLQIKLWDLRTAKCVKQYKGHHNEYAILPLHVNEEEGLLTAGVLTFSPSTCRMPGSDFLNSRGVFLSTAGGSSEAVNSSKFRRNLALDIL